MKESRCVESLINLINAFNSIPTTFVNLPHQIDGKINNFVKELSMEGEVREAVLRKYDELRLTHPELPSQLRDFQVTCATS